MKARISLVICPGCGAPMAAFDIHDRKLAVAECVNCGKEFEVRQVKNGFKPIIKEIKVS